MSWEVVKLESSLGRYKEEWDRLNYELYAGHPLFDSRFYEPLLEYFGSGKEYLCVHTSVDGDVDGMLILSSRRIGIWSLFLPAQAQIAPILLKSPLRLKGLFKVVPGIVGMLELLNQDPSYSVDKNKLDELPVIRQKRALTIGVDVLDDFLGYWKNRSKNLQKNTKRYFNRVASEGGHRLVVHNTVESLTHALNRYGDMEAMGWKGKAGTAVSSDNVQGKFYQDLLSKYGEENKAFIYEMYVGDVLVASRLCISDAGMLVILKTAYDENYPHFAPSRLLLYLLLEREFEVKRFRRIEFYTDATKEQLSWCTDQRYIEHVLLFRNRLICYAYQVLGRMRGRKETNGINTSNVTVPESCGLSIKRYNALQDLPASYSGLFETGERFSYDLGLDWFKHLSSTALKKDDQVFIYGLERDNNGEAVAVLTVCQNTGKRKLSSLSTYYTSLFMPLAQASGLVENLTHLFESLRSDEKRWASIDLSPMAYGSTVFDTTVSALNKAGWHPFPYFCFGNWYLSVEGRNFDSYLKNLPSSLRHTIERKKKKLFCLPNSRIEVVKDGPELEEAMSAYEKVYRSSWKEPEPFPEFMPGLVRLYASKGQLRLGVVYVDGEPAAAQIWIVSYGKAAIYKLAYDEKYSNLSVGSILTAHLMEYVIDVDGVQEVDYLTGDDAYKQDWMSHRRERWGIRSYNLRTFSGLIGVLREYSRQVVKGILRGNKENSNAAG